MEEKSFESVVDSSSSSLAALTVEDILQYNFRESPGDNWLSLVDASEDLSLRDALDLMYDFKIRSLPVYSSDSQAAVGGKDSDDQLQDDDSPDTSLKDYIAIVSVMDVLCWMAWKTDQQDSSKVCLGDLIGITEESRSLWKFPATKALTELLLPVSKGVHSMLIFAERRGKQVPYILSQSDIVRFLYENQAKLDASKLNATLRESNILNSNRPFFTMSSSESPRTGYQKMWTDQVSALPIIDDDGKLVGTLSSSDLRSVSTDQFEKQLDKLAVLDFLKAHGGSGSDSQICVTSETTVSEALHLPVKHGIHRVWVVDDNMRPTHSITLSDLICTFVA